MNKQIASVVLSRNDLEQMADMISESDGDLVVSIAVNYPANPIVVFDEDQQPNGTARVIAKIVDGEEDCIVIES